MIERYTLPAMREIWSEENKFRKWLDVELAVCRAQAECRMIPQDALPAIQARAVINVRRIQEIEAEVKHDVIAFLTSLAEAIGPESRFVHAGMTSNDVVDTAQSLLIRDASEIIREDLQKLQAVLRAKALEFKTTPCIGRTHGVHAQPITFGHKLLLWYDEITRHIERFHHAAENICVGKLSGAVGIFDQLGPGIEKRVCEMLKLKTMNASQVIPRDVHAEYVSALALIGSSLEKFATEIRNLQRTEILEAEEFFSHGQKGSSAMPHKRNPVRCERISGMARLLRGYAAAAMENIPLWHERDISHSSAERVTLPDSTALADFMLTEFTDVMEHLLVYPERMTENIHRTKGLIFSQNVLLALTKKGLSREDAYRYVQECAMHVWTGGQTGFLDQLIRHPAIRKHLTEQELKECFNLEKNFIHIDYLFKRSNL